MLGQHEFQLLERNCLTFYEYGLVGPGAEKNRPQGMQRESPYFFSLPIRLPLV